MLVVVCLVLVVQWLFSPIGALVSTLVVVDILKAVRNVNDLSF
jgi:hypothetical protein